MAESNYWEATIKGFSALFQKPKMSDKLLQKPPFKYLFDIVFATIETTKFGDGLYNEQEKDAALYDNRDMKIQFLRKVIDLTQHAIGKALQAKPNKIVAGLEPENTNEFLQELCRSAVTPDLNKKGPKIVKKLLAKYEEEAKNGGSEQQSAPQAAEKPAEKPVEKPAEAPRKTSVKPEDKPQPAPSKKPSTTVTKGDEAVPVQKVTRPSSAVKAPPKQQNTVVKVQDNPAAGKGRGTAGVIVDKGDQNDDNDDNSKASTNTTKISVTAASGAGRSKFTAEAMKDDGIVPQAANEDNASNTNPAAGGGIKMSLRRKPNNSGQASSSGQDNKGENGTSAATDVAGLTALVQEIAKNANPLGKSLEFITDDIESMNHELESWTKQYAQHKEKLQAELKISDEMLQPIMDQIAEIEEKIADKKSKVMNTKAQLIKNASQIQTLLYSVVSTK